MLVFQSLQKSNGSVVRKDHAIQLEEALRDLFTTYDRLGGAQADVGKALSHQIDQCLGAQGAARDRLQTRVATLFRAKDLHGYVVAEPQWQDLKLQIMEMVLFHRTSIERWAAIRPLLLENLSALCGSGRSARVEMEQVKREMTHRSSRISRLLQIVALFNFDGDAEKPPENMMIRFIKGQFPEHCWETTAKPGAMAALALGSSWAPSEPLCRWEYLAADLLHTAVRQRFGKDAKGAEQGRRELPMEGGERGDVQWYCTLEPASRTGNQGEQLPLLSLQPAGTLAELQRDIFRKWGAEGVRALAVLFERLASESPGRVVSVNLEELAQAGSQTGVSQRKRDERLRKLWQVLERLSLVEIHQVREVEGRTTIHSAPLVALLEVGRESRRNPGESAFRSQDDTPGQSVRLFVEDCFYHGAGPGFAPFYRQIPDGLLDADPKHNPLAMSLYLWLRSTWESETQTEHGVVSLSARQLLFDAGIWVSESSRYRSLENLKRDLEFLQVGGWLGRWKIFRNSSRDAMEDTYRMEAGNRRAERGADAAAFEKQVSLVSA